MNILMMTNTYLPHTGGVARSVDWFSTAFRARGHGVLIVAPEFDNLPEYESDVVRVPAIQNFNQSDFSVRLPIPGLLTDRLDEFQPQIVHSHHPFLLGDTALRVAAARNLPIVFTHHTMYEQYTHYVPGDSPAMQSFVMRLATEYANLCDHVIAPSESVAAVLKEREVTVPITAIPTGIEPHRFADGDGSCARRSYGIPPDAFLVGHVGRLAPEKNLEFLAHAVAELLVSLEEIHFLLVGTGPSIDTIEDIFRDRGVDGRLHHPTNNLDGKELKDAYHAMDVFAFASKSETQGMVLAEAMTAGVPVVALDASGVREVVQDRVNGRLLMDDDPLIFAQALRELATSGASLQKQYSEAALQTAEQFSMKRCACRALAIYEQLIARHSKESPTSDAAWAALMRMIGEELGILTGVGRALSDTLLGDDDDRRVTQ